MTEARVIILGIPDLIMHENGHRRSYSTGKFELLNGVPIFSRYLRPSIGSCHDSCKFGEERALEIKARGPSAMSKETTESLGEGQHLDRTATSAERKKKSAISHKQSHRSKTQKRGNPIVNREISSTKEETVLSKLVSSPVKGTDVLVKHASDPKVKSKLSKQLSLPVQRCSNGGGDRKIRKSKDMGMFKHDGDVVRGVVLSLTKQETNSSKLVSSPFKETKEMVKHSGDRKMKHNLLKNYSLPVQRSSHGEEIGRIRKSKDMGNVSMNSLGIPSSRRNSQSKGRKEMRSSVKGERKVSIPSSSMPEEPSLKGVQGQNVRNSRNLNGVSHLSSQKNIRKPKSEQSSRKNVTEKPLHVVEQNADDKTQRPVKDDYHATDMSPSLCPSPDDKISRQVQNEVCMAQLSPLLAKQNLRRTKSFHVTQSRQSWPPSPKQKGSRTSLLGSRTARSETSSLASFSTPNGAFSEHGEIDIENQPSLLEKEHKNRGKGGTISLKDEFSLGQKLTFRRENVIDLQPEDSTLKRLTFRQRVLDDRKAIGNEEANTAQLFLFSIKKNLRCIQKRSYARRTKNKDYYTQSLPSSPPSPRENDLLGIQFGTCIARSYSSSLVSWSGYSDASSEHGQTDIEHKISYLEKELKNRRKTDGTSSLKEGCTPGRKLTFTRGKVVELQSEDSNPSRLKFRERVLDDNQNVTGDASKKTLKEQEDEGGEDSVSDTDSKKVVLKHQDSPKKEDSRSLFNNVIEKTVTELVKARKSKVEALVGAFETVISLQDAKPRNRLCRT